MRIRELSLTDFRSYERLEARASARGRRWSWGRTPPARPTCSRRSWCCRAARSHRARADAELIRLGRGAWRASRPTVSPRARVERREQLEVVLAAPGRRRARPQADPRQRGGPPRRRARPGLLRTVLFAPEEMLARGRARRRSAATTSTGSARQLDRRRTRGPSPPTAARSRSATACCAGSARARPRRDQLPYWDGVLIDGGRGDRRAAAGDPGRAGRAARRRSRRDRTGRGPPGAGVRHQRAGRHRARAPGEALRRRLAETAEKELWNGATLVGPHRDDVRLPARRAGPVGVRVARPAAHARSWPSSSRSSTCWDGATGWPPLLLLDDVFSELDPERRAHLVRRIRALPQAFVTTTALEDLDPALVAASTAWRVSPGHLEPVG